jgi:hypothetical protein
MMTLAGQPAGPTGGGALPAALRQAAAAAGNGPFSPAPHTETMTDPPGAPDLLDGSGHRGWAGAGAGGGGCGAGAREEEGEGGGDGMPAGGRPDRPLPPPPPPPDHRPWPGGAALVTGPDGRPLLMLAPRGAGCAHMQNE